MTAERHAEKPTRAMTWSLRAATFATVTLAILGLLPGDVGDVAAGGAVGVVVAAPLARVAWLGARWAAAHDRRFASLAVALLAVVASGVVLAAA